MLVARSRWCCSCLPRLLTVCCSFSIAAPEEPCKHRHTARVDELNTRRRAMTALVGTGEVRAVGPRAQLVWTASILGLIISFGQPRLQIYPPGLASCQSLIYSGGYSLWVPSLERYGILTNMRTDSPWRIYPRPFPLSKMGKRSRSYSSSSSSGYDSEDDHHRSSSSKRSKKSYRSSSSRRNKPAKSDQIDVDDDFYRRSSEFRYWLAHDSKKRKDFTKLDSKDQRRYFKKFVRRWNKGKLDSDYYSGLILGGPATPAPPNPDAVQTNGSHTHGRGEGTSVVRQGPTIPTSEDLILSREAEQDFRASQRDSERAEAKRTLREAKQEARENQATGRDRLQEKRLEKRNAHREIVASKEQGSMEFGDDVLMGSGASDSFKEAIRRRDASKQAQMRNRKVEAKKAVLDEKRTEHQKKEDDTMAMVRGWPMIFCR